MKIKTLIFIAVFLILLANFNCKKDTPKEFKTEKTEEEIAAEKNAKKIVLQINEKEYSNSDLKLFLNIQYGDLSSSTENSKEPDAKIISRLFDSFIENKIILYIANQYNIPIEQSELDNYIDKLKILKEKIDKAAIIEIIKVQKFLFGKLYDSIKVSELEIRNYYNNHIDEFRKKPEILLHQILTKDRDSAIKIRSVLDSNPQDFAKVAKKDSISMDASKGGKMGYFEEGTLPKDMEQVVFSLEINNISPVVESTYGFHIFKITEKRKGRLVYLEKVKEKIKQKILSEKIANSYQEFLGNVKQDLAIKINYDNLYFNYQSIKGDFKDENTQTDPSNNNSNHSS